MNAGQVWKWPGCLAGLIVFGLLAALLGQEESWWIVSWIALGVPLAVILACLVRS